MRKVILILALALLLVESASAVTVTVDDSGGKDYLKIQDAVDFVLDRANTDTSNTIIVYPGTYVETLSIDMNPVMYGLSQKAVVLKSNSGDATDTIINGYITVNVGIGKRFEINGFSISGIKLIDGNQYIFNNLITGSGIYSARPLLFFVEDNKFKNCDVGLAIHSPEDYQKRYVNNNIFKDNLVAIELYSAGFDNYITDNFIDGGGVICTTSGMQFKNNTIKNGGINLDSCTHVSIKNNKIHDCFTGCSVRYCGSSVTIESNEIYANTIGISTNSLEINIFDNYLCNSQNVNADYEYQQTLNTTAASGPNIMGGPSIGGNYWGNPQGTGFSDTHSDNDGDGFCDETYYISEEQTWVDYLPLVKVASSSVPSCEVPEFPTIALPMIAIVGLALFFKRR